jgi:glycerate dehydrogenase
MKAVFLDFDTMGDGLDMRPLQAVFPDITVHDVTANDQIAERIQGMDIVFTNKIRLSADFLATAPDLKFIGLTATGTDNIDLETARAHGIAVANIRDYCTQSVAEHVFAVLLTLTRSLPEFRQTVREGAWQKAADPFLLVHPVRELSAMTMGIVGYGALGQGVARIAATFGMDVIIAARRDAASVPDDRVSFDALIETADVISLHCPLTDDTRNMLGSAQFRRMKDSAIVINTARGGLIDSAALAAALTNGDIAAAGIDVLPKEPPVHGDPLLDYAGNNLVITPHIAWASDEARQNAINELAENAQAFMAGERRNRVV